MKADVPKQYLQLHGKTILEHTIEKLLAHSYIDTVVVAISESDPYFSELPIANDSRVIRVNGGKERADSVLSALTYLEKNTNNDNWVLVHDAARPCVAPEDINNLIEQVSEHSVGGILAAPVRDTMKRSNNEQNIESTVERANLWHALTPQMFKIKELKEALEEALEANVVITDEASAMEWLGLSPKLVAGRTDNLKVTQPEDLALAEFYLSREIQA
ncbi:2-C-methyl-D-erythritol 4-phosphate cytidylyltransferase [Vibrio sp. HN007]|uniref:2-C-methyl-D-erythritol 4-phosphate cytidylyltransferase n=1 Tax=Vibrio iocasae TaxID=3098914 RepID=UPI0035D4D86A